MSYNGDCKDDWVPDSERKNLHPNLHPNVFTVKWELSTDKFFEFVRKYRSLIGVPLGGSKKLKYTYPDVTLSTVLTIAETDNISVLPLRLPITNFITSKPITSYGCIYRYSNKNYNKSKPKNGILVDLNFDEPNSESICNTSGTSGTNANGETSPSPNGSVSVGTESVQAEYLMIKRNDSLSYVELIHGNYRESQLFFMLKQLTSVEVARLLTYSYEQLWWDLHLKPAEGSAFEYGKGRFQKIAPCLKELCREVPTEDPNGRSLWLFPKGRPNYLKASSENRAGPESSICCALREFKEETNGMDLIGRVVLPDPVSERYMGTNSKNYSTQYFVFETNTKQIIPHFERKNTGIRDISIGESLEIKWVGLSELPNVLLPGRMELINHIERKIAEGNGIYPANISSIWNAPVSMDDFVEEF